VCVCGVCVLFVDLFQDDLRCLFSTHQVNHGGVQKAPAQVSLYKSHTTEEPLRRRRSVRYYLEEFPDLTEWHMLFPPLSVVVLTTGPVLK
jgi:hypothetical protein